MIQNLTQSASDQTNVVIQTNETNDADSNSGWRGPRSGKAGGEAGRDHHQD